MSSYKFQIRDNITGHLIKEKTSREACIRFLTARNASIYVITALTYEARSIMNGAKWLNQQALKEE
jgi:hypothetical protein